MRVGTGDLNEIGKCLARLNTVMEGENVTVVPVKACLQWVGEFDEDAPSTVCAEWDHELGCWTISV